MRIRRRTQRFFVRRCAQRYVAFEELVHRYPFSLINATPSQLDLRRQSISAVHRGSLPKTTAGGQPRFRGKSPAQKFRKKLYVI